MAKTSANDPLAESTRLFLQAVACTFLSIGRLSSPHPTSPVVARHLHMHLANLKQSVDDDGVHRVADAMMEGLLQRLQKLEENPLLDPIDGPPH